MPVATVNGVDIHYIVKGDGVPLLCIHPPVLSGVNFTHQLNGLSHICRVIAPDLRGHGRSEHSREPVTYSLFADDLKALLDHLQIEKAYLCGYSTGASILCEFAFKYPERISGGIVVSGMSEVSDWGLKALISLAVRLSNRRRSFWPLAWTICWSNSDTIRLFLAMLHDARKDHIDNVRQYYRYSLGYNCTKLLPMIKAPMLVVCGTKDKRFVRYGGIMHAGLPNSMRVFVEGATHQLPGKWAAPLNTLIREFVVDRAEKAPDLPWQSRTP